MKLLWNSFHLYCIGVEAETSNRPQHMGRQNWKLSAWLNTSILTNYTASQRNAFKFVTALKAESPTQRWINKNSPILAEVSQWWHQFIINDLLADLSVRQHQISCCVASCCYSFVWVSHLPGTRGDEAGELRQNLLCYKEVDHSEFVLKRNGPTAKRPSRQSRGHR